MSSAAPLENFLSRYFINRSDVRAVQTDTGAYMPDVVDRRETPPRYYPWTRQALIDHLSGARTYGHYLLGKENTVKLFAFDIDLDKTGKLPTIPMPDAATQARDTLWQEEATLAWLNSFQDGNPREAWLDRSHPARDYLKTSMRLLAARIQSEVKKLQIPTAVSYTGAKGLHVYGFLATHGGKPMDAADARGGAELVLEALPMEAVRGDNFYKWTEAEDPMTGLELFTVEIFPKQTSLSEGGFGNLMRLPMGKNRKSPDPCFFVDEDAPMGVLRPVPDAHAYLSKLLEG